MEIKEILINSVCFIRNNKPLISSKKLSILNKNLISIVKTKTSFLDELNPTLTQRITYIINDIGDVNRCRFCNKKIINIHHKYCSYKCNNNSNETKNKFREKYNNLSDEEKRNRIKKRENTFNIKYGGYTLQVEFLTNKVKKKMLENYGVSHSFHSEEIKNKARKTWLINYGVDNPFKSREIINKIKEILQNKYGVSNAVLINNVENVKKQKRTKILRGLIIPDEFLTDYKKYRKTINNLTRKSYNKYKAYINPKNFKRVTNGNDGYQLDHKYSIFEGFINNIDVNLISHPCNLELITWEENIKKSKSSSINIEELKINVEKFNSNRL